MLLALLASAYAAGFHYLKAEAIVGVTDEATPEGGVGFSLVSDALSGRITFGAPRAGGHVVRGWSLEGETLGPVIGYVPPTFRGLVPDTSVRALLPWTPFRVGGDAGTGKAFEADLATHALFNVPGLWGVDPRHAYVGPSLGLGLNGTWWDGWRGEDAPVMTGKLTAETALGGGVTVRDTWYAQGRALAHMDLFGTHQGGLGVSGATGVFLDRAGLPLGLEVRGDVTTGNDTVTTGAETDWGVFTSVYWKLSPEYQTRIEEQVERKREAEERAALAAGYEPAP